MEKKEDELATLKQQIKKDSTTRERALVRSNTNTATIKPLAKGEKPKDSVPERSFFSFGSSSKESVKKGGETEFGAKLQKENKKLQEENERLKETILDMKTNIMQMQENFLEFMANHTK